MEQPEDSLYQNSLDKNAQPDASTLVDEEDPSQLMRTEVRQGSRPGDVRVRLVRPSHAMFRRLDAGVLEATEAAQMPRTGLERFTMNVKRVFIGTPIATAHAENERLPKFKALAVLSSDAISSVAYATEAILFTLVAAGSGRLWLTLPLTLAIVALLCIVVISYRQTIPAYPNGGGSYIVAKDNLGTTAGLTAAASLMLDYILTVSVSVSAGVQALVTLFPALVNSMVLIDVSLVILITIVNLRGVRESGSIFAIPTYVFIVSALFLIIVGTIKVFIFQHHGLVGHFPVVAQSEPLNLFLLLKAFAAGCSAMTGVEAISNGIPAFKKPEPRNAAITLTWMAVILGTLFIGISVLALAYGIEATPITGNPTVIGQIAALVFDGPLYFMFPVFQFATLLILTLAANTSYSDFPRLSSLLARDHFLPHQFAFRGDRLAFSTGIIVLAVLASLLLVVFGGSTTLLINLYAVGVFLSFTLSQAGMVLHWWRLRSEHRGWQRSMFINGLGAVTTLLVAVVIATTKFLEGAWVVVILIPLLILMFIGIRKHYLHVERERTSSLPISPKDIHHRLIVPIVILNQATRQSVAYARSMSEHVTAVHIDLDGQKTAALKSSWEEWQASLTEKEQVALDIIEPVHRFSIVRSLVDYISEIHNQHSNETLTIILPEAAGRSVIGSLFVHPKTFRLKTALFFRPEIIVTNVPRYEQSTAKETRPRDMQHRFIVPVAELDRATLQSLAYARSISPRVAAVHVAVDSHDAEVIHEKWARLQPHLTKKEGTQLVIIESPYRALTRPLLAYIETVRELHPEETVTVILPEFVVAHWWEYLLHNQTAWQLKNALFALPNLVVTDIPQHLKKQSPIEKTLTDVSTTEVTEA